MKNLSAQLIEIIKLVLEDSNEEEVNLVIENFQKQRVFDIERASFLTDSQLTALGLATFGDLAAFKSQMAKLSVDSTRNISSAADTSLASSIQSVPSYLSDQSIPSYLPDQFSQQNETQERTFKYSEVPNLQDLFLDDKLFLQRMNSDEKYNYNFYREDLKLVVRKGVDDLIRDWKTNSVGLRPKEMFCPTKELKQNLAKAIITSFPIFKLNNDDDDANDFFSIHPIGKQHFGHIQTRLRFVAQQSQKPQRKSDEGAKKPKKRKVEEKVVAVKKSKYSLAPSLELEQLALGRIPEQNSKFTATVEEFKNLFALRPDIAHHEEVLLSFPNLLAYDGMLLWSLAPSQGLINASSYLWEEAIKNMIIKTTKVEDFNVRFGNLRQRFDDGIAAVCYWAYFVCLKYKQNELNKDIFVEIFDMQNIDDPTLFGSDHPQVLLRSSQFGIKCDKIRRLYSNMSIESAMSLLLLTYHFFNYEYPVALHPFFKVLEKITNLNSNQLRGKQATLLKILKNID